MLWDRGTWTPEVDDVDAALAKGDLKMTLDGFKLKGSWVLVRTGGRWGSGGGGDRSWLLIKHKDEWAGDVDIAEFAPRSVKSEGDFEDILAADKPDVWQSHRPAKGGEAGAMLESIIARAAALKAGRTGAAARAAAPAAAESKARSTSPARKTTRKPAAKTAAKSGARKAAPKTPAAKKRAKPSA